MSPGVLPRGPLFWTGNKPLALHETNTHYIADIMIGISCALSYLIHDSYSLVVIVSVLHMKKLKRLYNLSCASNKIAVIK